MSATVDPLPQVGGIGESRPRALIMKGGGVKGIAYASAALALEEYGFTFDTYAGTSAGAIAATLLAFTDPSTVLAWMEHPENHPSNLFGRWGLRAIVKLIRTRTHAFAVDKFEAALERALKQSLDQRTRDKLLGAKTTFADLPTGRTLVIFTSRQGGIHIYSGSGGQDSGKVPQATVVQAVLESITIPFIFQPQTLPGGVHVFDGGLLANFPLDAYRRDIDNLRADQYVALYLDNSPPHDFTEATKGRLAKQMSALIDVIVDRDDRIYADTESDSFVFIKPYPIGTADFDLRQDEIDLLRDCGRLGALQWLTRRPDVPTGQQSHLQREIVRLQARVKDCRQIVVERRTRIAARKATFASIAGIAGIVALISLAVLSIYAVMTIASRPQLSAAAMAKILPTTRQTEYHDSLTDLMNGYRISQCNAETHVRHAWVSTPDAIYSVREFQGPEKCSVVPGLSDTKEEKATVAAAIKSGAWYVWNADPDQPYNPPPGEELRLILFAAQQPEVGGLDHVIAFARKLGRLESGHEFNFEFIAPNEGHQTFKPLLFGVSFTLWERILGWSADKPPGNLEALDLSQVDDGNSMLDTDSVISAAATLQGSCNTPGTANDIERSLCDFLNLVATRHAVDSMHRSGWRSSPDRVYEGVILFHQVPQEMTSRSP